MIKIGIIGSDNSHGLAFSKLVNFKNEATGAFDYPELKITAIYGENKEQTESVAKEGGIEWIASEVTDMIDKVDAVMVIFRDGNLHAQYAKPFIEQGIPVWIDKPFTANVKEAEELVALAKEKQSLLTGGSTLKYAVHVDVLKNAVRFDKGLGQITGGYLNFPGDIHSEYAGIYFYGPHMVEMLLAIFGRGVKAISTRRWKDEIVAFAEYENFQVTMDFTKSAKRYVGIVHGANKTVIEEIDLSTIYRQGFDKFYEMLITKENPELLDELVLPVKVLDAIEQSLTSGATIVL